MQAVKNDSLYLVPAFTGLGAPYWKDGAKASVVGMDRITGRNEFVRAGVECIAYQIMDIVHAMEGDSSIPVKEIRVDGGSTRNPYLMQFQSDILNVVVQVPEAEELSGIGAAYMAGMALGIWNEDIFGKMEYKPYYSTMEHAVRKCKVSGWKNAVESVLHG